MFEALQAPAPDKIMALAEAFRADDRPGKLDLGVGVYKDAAGRTPIIRAVKEAESRLLDQQSTKTYLGPAGDTAFCDAMVGLVFGAEAPRGRIAAVQTPGGTGACRLLCELAARAERGATMWFSDPTWPNHHAIAKQVGLGFRSYRYFDPATCEVDWEGMKADLRDAGPGDVVVLHGCCHNPTGANLDAAMWRELAALAVDRGFTPFIDIAYQGFGDGLEEDAEGLRIMAAAVPELLVAASCSKNFAVYRDRVGCAMALCGAPAARTAVQETMKALARVNHSMPPDHGAAAVRMVLEDPGLRADWERELAAMRARMLSVRAKLAESLQRRTNSDRFDFIGRHRGMFSLLGVSPEVVETARAEHAVYIVTDGRINIAGLNDETVETLTAALAAAGA